MKVCKFGGTSLANPDNILKAKDIVLADSSRTFVVVSAPGKCASFDRKVTDLLIDAHAQLCFADTCDSCDSVFTRFEKIAKELNVDMDAELERVREEVYINRCNYDFIVSRGEYLMATLFAKVLDYKFLDAAHYIVIKKSGIVDLEKTKSNFKNLKSGKYVMGGFYGREADTQGGVKVFPRGGSDYSGAIVAVCLAATMYENFTDTHGVQSANPTIVPNTLSLSEIDYATLYKLSKGGASVIYPECLPLLKKAAMPLKVCCTFDLSAKSTLVTAKKPVQPFFSITYETRKNINKDTVEILCILNKIDFSLSQLRKLLKGIEVYLVEFVKGEFRLIAPASNLVLLISLLHNALTELKSTASL